MGLWPMAHPSYNTAAVLVTTITSSPNLFILASEVLSSSIRESDNILGIKIQDIIHKICQYADDTILFMPFDVQSIDATFDIFEQFQAISGLKITFNKTEIFPIGPLKKPRCHSTTEVK